MKHCRGSLDSLVDLSMANNGLCSHTIVHKLIFAGALTTMSNHMQCLIRSTVISAAEERPYRDPENNQYYSLHSQPHCSGQFGPCP